MKLHFTPRRFSCVGGAALFTKMDLDIRKLKPGDLLTYSEAAELVGGVSIRQIRKWVMEGEIRAFVVVKKKRVLRSDLLVPFTPEVPTATLKGKSPVLQWQEKKKCQSENAAGIGTTTSK